MNTVAQQAIDSWNREVDAEMARLIERGTPPHRAARQAQETVELRRQVRSQEDDTQRLREVVRQHLGA